MNSPKSWTVRCNWWLVPALVAGCSQPTRAPVDQVPLREVTAQELRQAVHKPAARVVLVNMWATWCVPCREEFPDLVKLEKRYRDRGLRVVFVSWDADPEVARQFLAKQGVAFPSFIKTTAQGNLEFIDEFEPEWSGAFPATMIYDATGRLRHFWEGKRSYAEFERIVQHALAVPHG